MNYKLSILLPSKYPEKLKVTLANLISTMSTFKDTEIVICLDGEKETHREGNLVFCYRKAGDFASKYFETAYRNCTGEWILLWNDDVTFKHNNWDLLLELDTRNKYNLLYFRDLQYDEQFACHPLVSRKVWMLMDNKGLVFGNWKNMGCDTTIWDCIPDSLKYYMPEIEVNHERFLDQAKQDEIMEDYKNYNSYELLKKRAEVKDEIAWTSGQKNIRVLVGLITGEYVRQANYLSYFLGLNTPGESHRTNMSGQSPAWSRNQIVKAAIHHNFTHVFFMDDDMAVPPWILNMLLSRDKDMISGMYLMRSYPHRPVAFNLRLDGGYNKYIDLWENPTAVLEVTNAGMGCALIKTEVFKKMSEAQGNDYWFTLGELTPDQWCDDVSFFNRARDIGYKLFLDTGAVCGHSVNVTAWPERHNGVWHVNYKHGKGNNVIFVIPKPDIAEEQKEIATEAVAV